MLDDLVRYITEPCENFGIQLSWLEYSTDNRAVGGSSPPIPTKRKRLRFKSEHGPCSLGWLRTLPYFISGCSSVWLERVIWDHEAASSSLATRTIKPRLCGGTSHWQTQTKLSQQVSSEVISQLNPCQTRKDVMVEGQPSHIYPDVAQFGRALVWGTSGREFKSRRSDQPPKRSNELIVSRLVRTDKLVQAIKLGIGQFKQTLPLFRIILRWMDIYHLRLRDSGFQIFIQTHTANILIKEYYRFESDINHHNRLI